MKTEYIITIICLTVAITANAIAFMYAVRQLFFYLRIKYFMSDEREEDYGEDL